MNPSLSLSVTKLTLNEPAMAQGNTGKSSLMQCGNPVK